jgi:outer membrane protein assembly factor BamD (BamD/ComL family)
MSTKRIFTKRFLDLSAKDQHAVVSAAIQEIESCIGRYLNSEDDKKAERRIERIRAKARQYGIEP